MSSTVSRLKARTPFCLTTVQDIRAQCPSRQNLQDHLQPAISYTVKSYFCFAFLYVLTEVKASTHSYKLPSFLY